MCHWTYPSKTTDFFFLNSQMPFSIPSVIHTQAQDNSAPWATGILWTTLVNRCLPPPHPKAVQMGKKVEAQVLPNATTWQCVWFFDELQIYDLGPTALNVPFQRMLHILISMDHKNPPPQLGIKSINFGWYGTSLYEYVMQKWQNKSPKMNKNSFKYMGEFDSKQLVFSLNWMCWPFLLFLFIISITTQGDGII